jgi:hypothetical protein
VNRIRFWTDIMSERIVASGVGERLLYGPTLPEA